jgi:bifunctional DNase/RNase
MSMRRRIGGMVVLLAVTAGLVAARERSEPAPPKGSGPQEVEVIGLFVDPHGGQPAVVLEGKRDKRRFAMAIGTAEATGIAFPLQNVTPPRPLTHDLFLTVLGRLSASMTKAVITDLRDDIYYATVFLSSNGTEIRLDSRPSDAIALAVRARAPVLVEDRVFEKAGRLPSGPSGPRI